MMDDAEDEVLAHAAFPTAHWSKIASTNPLERVNKEIKRRADVVGIFPRRAGDRAPGGAVVLEQSEEWQVGRCYMAKHSLAEMPQECVIPTVGHGSPQSLWLGVVTYRACVGKHLRLGRFPRFGGIHERPVTRRDVGGQAPSRDQTPSRD